MQPRFNTFTHEPVLAAPYNYATLTAVLEEHRDLACAMLRVVQRGDFTATSTWRSRVWVAACAWASPYREAMQWACYFHPATDAVVAYRLRNVDPWDTNGERKARRLFFIGEGETMGFCAPLEALKDRFERALPR